MQKMAQLLPLPQPAAYFLRAQLLPDHWPRLDQPHAFCSISAGPVHITGQEPNTLAQQAARRARAFMR